MSTAVCLSIWFVSAGAHNVTYQRNRDTVHKVFTTFSSHSLKLKLFYIKTQTSHSDSNTGLLFLNINASRNDESFSSRLISQ